MASKVASNLSQRYTLKQEIGRGGFSVTWKAYRRNDKQQTGPPLVIKELLLDRIKDWESVAQFEREAKVLSHLKHDHIPNFVEYIESDEETGKRLFLVQEYIEGQDLEELIQEGKFFTEEEVIDIAQSMCNVLVYLHGFSPPMIHRDIKPSNMMLRTLDQCIFLIDFGAVKGPFAPDNHKGYTVTGTFGYMPIEQLEGHSVPASDLYALGMSLIYILSHQDPTRFPKKNLKLDFRPYVNISEQFAKILDQLIEPDFNKRLNSAKDLNVELEKLKKRPASSSANKFFLQKKSWPSLVGSLTLLTVLGLCTIAENKAPSKPPSGKVSQAINTALPIMTQSEFLHQANAFYDAKKCALAVKYYSAYLDQHPQDHQALNRRGYCYGEIKQHKAAVGDYEKVQELASDKYTVLDYNLGYNHYKQGHYATALSHFQSQVEKDPQNIDSINYLGLCYKHLKRDKEAIAAYKQVIAMKPDYTFSYNNLARLYHDREEHEAAELWYLKTIEIDPDYALAYYNLGELYYDLKDYPACIAKETLAIEKSGTYASAHNMRGLCYRKMKDLDPALDDFHLAVTQSPNYEAAYYNLGLTYDDKELFSEAMRMYQKAIEISPNYSPPLNNLGYIYQRKKDFDSALEYYHRAVSAKPSSSLYLRNRGDVYLAKGMCAEALSDWQKACKLGSQAACSLVCSE